MHRVLIAGTNSGCGKTTVTTGLLYSLKKRGVRVSAFKCGPDYIDPMFHREAIGVPSYNLDPFFSSPTQLCRHIAAHAGEISVIEGVMGYYDGIGTEGSSGTYDVACATDTPVILVINAKGMYTSVGAVIQGFRDFRDPSRIKGVIFNGISQELYNGLAQIAKKAGVEPLGFLPYSENIRIGSRHLGLVTTAELADLNKSLENLCELVDRYIDVDGILRIARSAALIMQEPTKAAFIGKARIAVAQDKAFCFLYPENIELMEMMGAELVFFSPLTDKKLPDNINGLYLCGGYPELYARQLSENESMLASIKKSVESGLPTIAECGGFLYLHDTLDGVPMVGVIHAEAYRTERLQRFGYVTLTAEKDNLICHAGESIPAHEFHYYASVDYGKAFVARKAGNNREYHCIHAENTFYAGFPHLYFPANQRFAESFIRKATEHAARTS